MPSKNLIKGKTSVLLVLLTELVSASPDPFNCRRWGCWYFPARVRTPRRPFRSSSFVAVVLTAYLCTRYTKPLIRPKVINLRMSRPAMEDLCSMHQALRVWPCRREVYSDMMTEGARGGSVGVLFLSGEELKRRRIQEENRSEREHTDGGDVRGAFLLHRLVFDKRRDLGGGCVDGAKLKNVEHQEATVVPIPWPCGHKISKSVLSSSSVVTRRTGRRTVEKTPAYKRCSMHLLTNMKSASANSAMRRTELIPLIKGTI